MKDFAKKVVYKVRNETYFGRAKETSERPIAASPIEDILKQRNLKTEEMMFKDSMQGTELPSDKSILRNDYWNKN